MMLFGQQTREEEPDHVFRVVALASNVLVVASYVGDLHEWRAYCGAVEGEDHSAEWVEVRHRGDKISKKIAIAIFGDPSDGNHEWSYIL